MVSVFLGGGGGGGGCEHCSRSELEVEGFFRVEGEL
jgi:hypothetical protein